MTLPTSGWLSLYEIAQEFGGLGGPLWLSNYYAGGPYVPAGTSGVNGAIPSSGPISIWNFFGASRAWTTTMSVGSGGFPARKGYGPQAGGSLSDNTCDLLGGAVVSQIQWVNSQLILIINGALPNSGWTTLKIGNNSVLRANAVYSVGANAQWSWGNQANIIGNGGEQVTVMMT